MVAANTTLLLIVGAVFAALAAGTGVRIVALRGVAPAVARSRLDSLRTWWLLAGCLAAATLGGGIGATVLLALAGFLGLREFLALPTFPALDRPAIGILAGLIVVYYLLIVFQHAESVRLALPPALLILIGGLHALRGRAQDCLRTTSVIFWSIMLLVYLPSHAIFLFQLPEKAAPAAGPAGWFLFLLILTEFNDIMQAIIGRRFGRRRITPKISPNKSLEGLLGGVAVTMLLAVVLAPTLTTLTQGVTFGLGLVSSAAAGLVIGVFGFLGDISMSAIKRDAGVKDGSSLLPGQGGMIDRIDSLTFTAPAFYYFVSCVRQEVSG